MPDDAVVRRSALAFGALALIGFAAGCGGTSSASKPLSTPALHPAPRFQCRIYNRGTPEYVMVHSDSGQAQAICRTLIFHWSISGEFWSLDKGPSAASYDDDARDCSNFRRDVEIDVYDRKGTQMRLGNATCSRFAVAGWRQFGY